MKIEKVESLIRCLNFNVNYPLPNRRFNKTPFLDPDMAFAVAKTYVINMRWHTLQLHNAI
jgi:hypothetical protein